MRYSTAIVGAVALCASEVTAFPAAALDFAAKAERDAETSAQVNSAIKRYQNQRRQSTTTFDAAAQLVSTSGEYAFVAPLATDNRGPCPGLNAMANHGYIPHNGVATIQEFIDGTYTAFGMGTDLGGFLGLYGAIFDGNGAEWSIGGPTDDVATITGLAGTPQGISGSHNKYEADVSPARPDLYEYGNDYTVILSQFEELYTSELGPAGYDLTVLTPFRAARFQQSVENNPYFFNGPFSGIAVQTAAYTFIFRFMGNKSAEYPEGYLDGEVLKSFYSITGEPGNFTWTEGYERFPDNWYKRAIGDEYTIPFFLTDLLAAAEEYPQFLDIGGNTGTVNSFTGIDIANLTSGVYNSDTLLEGNNLECFIFQLAAQATPDLLEGSALTLIDTLADSLTSNIDTILDGITCPTLQTIQYDQFDSYPGAVGTDDSALASSGPVPSKKKLRRI